MKYSLIIPCYNEGKNLPILLERMTPLMRNKNIEIILVDNGSPDDTQLILENLLPKDSIFISTRVEKNLGYGFGILSGLKIARGDALGWTHADMQTDPKDFLQAIKIFEENNCNCFVKGRRIKRPFSDNFFTVGMSIFETFLLRSILFDINAQPNLFPKSFFESWKNPPHDFSLDLYAYYYAKYQNLHVIRFPVLFAERIHGTSHWNINWRTKFKFIRRTIAFSLDLTRRSFK